MGNVTLYTVFSKRYIGTVFSVPYIILSNTAIQDYSLGLSTGPVQIS